MIVQRLARGVREAWWAASAPTSFYRALREASEPRLARAFAAAALSAALAGVVLALAFVRATASDGFLLAAALIGTGLLGVTALLVLLGGLVMVRPAALDLRAWEIAAWAWVPAGALAVSLAPAAVFAPAPAAAVGLIAWPFWHVAMVASGVAVFAPARRVVTLTLYLVAVFVVPGLLLAVSYAVMQGMSG